MLVDGPLVLELPNRRATTRLGRALAALLVPGDVVFLEGPLGAGKTFLTRSIARELGVPSSVPVQSPTFALVHELDGRVPIVHADLYRIGSAAELPEIGLLESMAAAVTLIEWGERFADEIAPEHLAITLARPIDGPRTATLRARGEAMERVVARLAPPSRS